MKKEEKIEYLSFALLIMLVSAYLSFAIGFFNFASTVADVALRENWFYDTSPLSVKTGWEFVMIGVISCLFYGIHSFSVELIYLSFLEWRKAIGIRKLSESGIEQMNWR